MGLRGTGRGMNGGCRAKSSGTGIEVLIIRSTALPGAFVSRGFPDWPAAVL